MDDPQSFPIWPIVLLFPVFFVVLWLGVVGLLATLGGWNALARRFPDPGDAARGNILGLPGTTLGMRRAGVPFPVSYKRCVTLLLSSAGLHLRVMAFFRFRHPPILVPWEQVEGMDPGRMLAWRTLAVRPRGSGARILLYGYAAEAVQASWERRAAAARERAPL